MQWEELTAAEFRQAVHDTGVCIVNMAVLEKHGDHLPVGTDLLLGHKLACLAAEHEPAVVFPPYYFGKVFEATCYPGAVALGPSLLVELAQRVFDEIARNGFKKILLYNSHGGNWHLMHFLAQCNIASDAPYALYLPQHIVAPELMTAFEAATASPKHEHAGLIETSLALALIPDLVRYDRIPDSPIESRERLAHLSDIFTGISWFADFPDHIAGDPKSATLELGEKLRDIMVNSLATQIAMVKNDEVAPLLKDEFFRKLGDLSEPSRE